MWFNTLREIIPPKQHFLTFLKEKELCEGNKMCIFGLFKDLLTIKRTRMKPELSAQ